MHNGKPSITYGHLTQSVWRNKAVSAGHELLSLGEIGASGEPRPRLGLAPLEDGKHTQTAIRCTEQIHHRLTSL